MVRLPWRGQCGRLGVEIEVNKKRREKDNSRPEKQKIEDNERRKEKRKSRPEKQKTEDSEKEKERYKRHHHC